MTGRDANGMADPIFIGVDLAPKDGGFSAEVEWRVLPDGTIFVQDMRQWCHELELQPAEFQEVVSR